jgi:hypothetical protein
VGYQTVVRILVLTTEAISAEQLRAALPEPADPRDAEIMVIAPALHESALRFWFSDADKAIVKAEQVRRESLDQLGEQGVTASADIGEADPEEAIADALKTFDADRIVVFTHPGGEQLYREDADWGALGQRFGIPISHATVADSSS